MLSAEDNDLLTRVGLGSRMGNLLRRYWQPVAGTAEMQVRDTMKVRIFGENLVLFKDKSGKLGLIAESCPHRAASLAYGIPTEDGIRCPYHGWRFNGEGRCLEQPNESDTHALKGTIVTKAYPVQELAGLVFAYLGPEPAPLLPRFDGFVNPRAIRHIGKRVIPCNWLQIMENSVDPVHTEWLHGAFYEYRQKGKVKVAISKHHAKIAFDEFPFGIVKRRLMENQSEDADDWKTGHPLVFPNTLAGGSGGGLWTQQTFQIRVPVDDTNTLHFWYHAYVPPEDADVPEHLLNGVPVYEPPVHDSNGEFLLDYIHAQDIMAWTTQGPIADRTREKLGASDKGIVMYRKMLKRELEKVDRGEDPIGLIRDSAQNQYIHLPRERGKDMYSDGFVSQIRRQMSFFSPIAEELIQVFTKDRARAAVGPRAPAAE